MKKIVLMVLVSMFVLTVIVSHVYAVDETLTSGANVGTGTITIAASTFTNQINALTFKTSSNVLVGFSVASDNYTAISGHTTGDRMFGMDSTGGTMWTQTKASGTDIASSDIIAASATGAATWTGWTAQ